MILDKLSTSNIIFIENEDINRNSSGGVMSYILNLSNYFRNQNFKTILYGCGVINKCDTNKNFTEFNSVSINASMNNLKFFLNLFVTKELNRINSKDIIHVQRPEMVIPIAIRKRNRIICTLHGGQDLAVIKKKGRLVGYFYSFLQLIAFFLVDQLIAVDKVNMNRYVDKYPWIKKKIKVIPICVDTSKFYPQDKINSRLKFKILPDEKVMLFIGRLEYEKNVEFIIKCFKEINDPKFKLIIAGKGSLSEVLKMTAKSHEDRIIFLGELNNTQIPTLINAADVMVLASFFEGSPTVVKEALCCNVPVISTNVGDVKEVIESVNGGRIFDYNVRSFLEAVDHVFSMNKDDIQNASDLFNKDIMGENTRRIYYKL